MFYGKQPRNVSVNLNCLFCFLRLQLFFQSTHFFPCQLESTRFFFLMKHLMKLFATVTMKSDEVFFSVYLLNTETNSLNTLMQPINPNYTRKKTVKQIKTTQQKLLQQCFFSPMRQNLIFSFLLPFIIYLSGFDLFSLSNFCKILLMDSLDIFKNYN